MKLRIDIELEFEGDETSFKEDAFLEKIQDSATGILQTFGWEMNDDLMVWFRAWEMRLIEAAVKGTINPENPKQVPGERYYAICPSEGMSLMKSYPSLEAAMDRLTRYLRSFPRNVVGANCRGWLIVGANRWKPSREEIGKGYWVGE